MAFLFAKPPFEQFRKAVGKGETTKAKKLMKSFDILAPFHWHLHKTEPIYPIHYISSRANRAILNMVLIEHESSIHQTTKSGLTTLHFAVLYSNWEVIEELLSRGVDVDARETSRGFSALHFAVEKRNMGAVKRLLDDGMADMNLPDNTGSTPKTFAQSLGSKQIQRYFQKHEEKTRYDKDMQSIAAEQTRQAQQQEEIRVRNVLLEARFHSIKHEVADELRQDRERLKAEMAEEVRRLTREELARTQSATSAPSLDNRRLSTPSHKAPPIPPRTRIKSCSSRDSLLPQAPTNPASKPPTKPIHNESFHGCEKSANFAAKVDWFNNLSSSKSFVSTDSCEIHSRNPSLSQLHVHINLADATGSKQRLMESFGSQINLSSTISESDITSGFGSRPDISEGEELLSVLAKCQINSNLPDLIYYIKYDKIEPALISKGVVDVYDIEHLRELKINRQQVTYLLTEIILKRDNQTLRSFLEALEENGYSHHAKKIRDTKAIGYYTSELEQRSQMARFRRSQIKSTPNMCISGFSTAVESNDAEEHEDF